MGEKEQGAATAREAGSGMATGRVFPETNVAQSDAEGGGIGIDEEGVQRTGQPLGSAAYAATGRESAIGEDDWEAPVSLATGDPDGGGNGIAIGDPGVNGNIVDDPAATAINNSHSNIKNLRLGSGGTDDDGDGAEAAEAGRIRIDSTPARISTNMTIE